MAEDINTLLDQIIQRYQPGGEFGKAALATLEQRKGKTLASQQQSLVSAGLSGTTIGAGLGSKFEQEIGTPFRLGVEEQRLGALTQAMQAKAGYLERGEERETALSEAEKERQLREFGMLISNRQTGPATPAFPQTTAQEPWQPGGGEGGQLSSFIDNYQVGGETGGMGVYGISGAVQDPTIGQEVLGGPQAGSIYVGGGGSVGGQTGTTTITLEGGGVGTFGKTKTIQVPASALGSGVGGFKDETTYKAYVPAGYRPVR